MSIQEVKVPDIGDFRDVPVIEIFVKAGDIVRPEDPLVSLESDKATMEVPSPAEGKIVEILVRTGERVSEGALILKLEPAGGAPASTPAPAAKEEAAKTPAAKQVQAREADRDPVKAIPPPIDFGNAHASPSVRRIARELGVELGKVKGTGDKGRITIGDVKRSLSSVPASTPQGSGIPEIPAQDFAKFGPIEEKALSRLKRLSGPHLHRAWLNVPHVTHADEADITELEAYRKSLDGAGKDKGYRVTLLSFLIKASVTCLKEYPEFNSSLSANKDSLILKRYYNIGVAVDTPDGLVVPVIKDANAKGLIELSRELGEVSARMRDAKINPSDVLGGTFSISSLGGIGGTHFTPIVNAPEVAILGVVRAQLKPVWLNEAFVPRLILPLSVSYDHRVIDGALAARFTRRLAEILGDVRQMVL